MREGWLCQLSTLPYFFFVETAERQSGTVNYSAFIEHMLENDSIYGVYEVLPTDCFANILFGPEVFQGAGSFTINDFTVTRQY